MGTKEETVRTGNLGNEKNWPQRGMYTCCNPISMTLQKWHNSRDIEKASGCRGLRAEVVRLQRVSMGNSFVGGRKFNVTNLWCEGSSPESHTCEASALPPRHTLPAHSGSFTF